MFSEREKEVIKAIGRATRSIEQVTEEVFDGANKPFDANISVGNTIRRIVAKCEHHNLKWTLGVRKIGVKNFYKRIER